MAAEIPDWCRWHPGRNPLLVVAPHGGRRTPAPGGRGVRMNDLHTAALAETLAARLDAALLCNPVLDRNRLDLNRLTQLQAGAPWFLALLERLLGELLARHRRAAVLVVHGWNTMQAACDVGLGHRLATPAAATAHAPALTAAPAFVAGPVARLIAAGAARGVAVVLGERYPARHPDNPLQLFRRAGHPAASPALAGWVAEDRVDAVQLELGVPLRWPGPRRAAFLDALCHAFGDAPARRRHRAPSASAGRTRAAPRGAADTAALQCYDPAARLGIAARLDRLAGERRAGRVLLFLPDGGVALFTGEAPHARSDGVGLHLRRAGTGFRLHFDGCLLRTENGDRYIDLEDAFAASRLLAATLDLTFAPTLDAAFGGVHGALTLDGRRHAIAAPAFASAVAPALPHHAWQARLSLSAAFGAAHAWRLDHQVPGHSALAVPGDAPRPPAALAIWFDGHADTPRRIIVDDGRAPLVAEPIARLRTVRPVADGRQAQLALGVARFTRAGNQGWGFYEYARATKE